MAGHKRFVTMETSGLSLALPKHVLTDEQMTIAFDIALSFDTWRRLRQDQRLSRPKATAVVEKMLDALIAVVDKPR